MRVISRLRYKQDGEGFWDGRWKHVFVVSAAGGEPRQLTREDCDHLDARLVAGRHVTSRTRRTPRSERRPDGR